jgi:hypothetical protein
MEQARFASRPFDCLRSPARGADALMADEIPTSRGKTRWHPATIRAVVTSDNAAAYSVSTRRSVSCSDTVVGKGSERLPGPISRTHRRVGNTNPPA